ncbi:MAG: NAD(+) synthase [Clostridiales bacterium]|nr:NAD(+) synthase [Clostridiales bacterium]
MDIEMKIEKTVEWLRNKVNEAGAKGLIVGLSGGIDSSVVAFLIKKAFPENSLGIIMPIHSQLVDQNDAESLAKVVDIDYHIVDLSQDHLNIKEKVLSKLKGDVNDRGSDSNLRARLRMSTLYTFANALNYLVVGTDNAAEVLTGYFTKYGDGGVDILPIAHLTKREVYEWGKYLGVPKSILDRAPSAGLWEGQTDEDEMGVTYKAIDDYIEGKEISEKDRKVIERLFNQSKHKREMPPAPPKYQ